MYKFKVGDKVRIRLDIPRNRYSVTKPGSEGTVLNIMYNSFNANGDSAIIIHFDRYGSYPIPTEDIELITKEIKVYNIAKWMKGELKCQKNLKS